MSKLNTKTQLPQTIVSGSRFVPMLFSTPMVQALLNGTKTETRRTQGLEKINENPNLFRYDCFEKEIGYHYFERINIDKKPLEKYEPIKSKMNVGDIIWVRETFTIIKSIETGLSYILPKASFESYKDKLIQGQKIKWKPSLFMPKDACRIFLKCVSVHAERLQDIDEQSAINEGIEVLGLGFKNYDNYVPLTAFDNSKSSYFSLWSKINGLKSLQDNPFVWVYKFVKVDAPDDFR